VLEQVLGGSGVRKWYLLFISIEIGSLSYRLKYTRAILDAIHSGELAEADYETYETFKLHIPTTCSGVPSELLNPKKSWNGKADFKEEVIKLGRLFVENFKKYEDEATSEVIKAGMLAFVDLYQEIC
jgi:phosphoenolpyruvate carboxykinase (ATP)